MVDRSLDIRIDEESHIRFLSSEDHEHMTSLKSDCKIFSENSKKIADSAAAALLPMERLYEKVNIDKLKAIGRRNMVENEYEDVSRLKLEMNTLLEKKQSDLEQYKKTYQSLMEVLSMQESRMESMGKT